MIRALKVLAALLVFSSAAQAQSPGWLDAVSGGVASGWSQDAATPARSIVVHFYVDGPAGQGQFIGQASANQPRPDVVRATGVAGQHGFRFALPAAYRSGAHRLYAYGLSIAGANPLLAGSPLAYGSASSAGAPAPTPRATTPVAGSSSGSTAPSPVAGGRGLRWVQQNPMFISALTTQMPAPPANVVNRYFDVFGANAIHLWELGLPDRLNGWLRHRPGARWLSWVHSDGTSLVNRQVIGGVRPTSGRIGYQAGDEPNSVAQLQEILRGLGRVAQADPAGLRVVNFSMSAPDLGQQLAIVEQAPECDVISYDLYSRDSRGVYDGLERIRDSGLRAGKPYWRYLYSYVDGEGPPSDSDMRWNAFIGLVYGYTGHSWFLYQVPSAHGLSALLFDREGDWNAAETVHFARAAKINRELANLGRAITQLTSVDVRYFAKFWIKPSATRRWSKGAGGDPFLEDIDSSGGDLSVGYFKDGRGERYLMVQNINHTHGHFTAKTDRATNVRLEFDFGGATDPTLDKNNVEVLDRVTGQVRVVPLKSRFGRMVLETRLNAGDVILMKYKTAKPFARR